MSASGYKRLSSGLARTFTDDFKTGRVPGRLGDNWGLQPVGGGNAAGLLLADPRISGLTDGANGFINAESGGTNKRDIAMWCAPLANIKVRGQNQYSQFKLVSEQGTSSFCGPSVAQSQGALNTCYAIIFRNSTWRLCRMQDAVNTDLIGATALVIPCTLRIEVIFNGATNNTITVKRNGVTIGSFVDSSAVIQATGVPGFYAGCPSAGESSQWRDFDGGLS